ncbi:MAG: PAS domain-containing protein, partial [Verrucomicrobiota bacterium]
MAAAYGFFIYAARHADALQEARLKMESEATLRVLSIETSHGVDIPNSIWHLDPSRSEMALLEPTDEAGAFDYTLAPGFEASAEWVEPLLERRRAGFLWPNSVVNFTDEGDYIVCVFHESDWAETPPDPEHEHIVLMRQEVSDILGAAEIQKQRAARIALAIAALMVTALAGGLNISLNGLTRTVRERTADLAAANASLADSQERFELAVRGSNAGIFDWNLRDETAFYSQRFREIIGYGEEYFPGVIERWRSSLHPDDAPRIKRQFRSYLERKIPVLACEYRLRHRSGYYKWVFMQAEALWDKSGQGSRLAGSILDISERKAQELNLAKSRERYELAAQGSRAGIWDWDLMTGELYFSETWKAMLGYEPNELPSLLETWKNLLHPDDRDSALTAVNEFLAGNRVRLNFEFRMRCKDGSYSWINSSGAALRDDHGKALRVAGSHIDITETRENAEKLRRSEARQREVLASIQEIVFQTDATGQWSYLNTAWEHLTSESISDTLSRPFIDSLHPQDAQPLREAFDELLDGRREVFRQIIRIRTHNGGYLWMDAHLRVRVDAKGKPLGVAGTLNDVTEQKTSQDALMQFKHTLDATLDAVSMIDPLTGRFTYVNRGATLMTGYSREELLKRGLNSLTGSITEAKFGELLDRLASGDEESVVREIMVKHARGHHIPAELFLQYITPAGGPPRFLALLHDVTERKRFEEQVQTAKAETELLNTELIEVNNQLERSITHANQLARKAEAANLSKSRFLANVSHDIRTPLNGIMGFLPLLEKKTSGERERTYLRYISESADSLLTLINDLLDFSKIEAGQFRLDHAPYDPRECVEAVCNLMQVTAAERGIELRSEVPEDMPASLMGDHDRLVQILFNLVSNAVKFSENQPVDIRLRYEKPNQDHMGQLWCSVEDRGIGIPKDKQATVFDPFEQAGTSRTERIGSSGLGLSICRSLCRLMEGEIGVESEPKHGSTFTFHIAAKNANPEAKPEEETEEEPDVLSPEFAENYPLRVLIVEDSLVNREVLNADLDEMGYQPDAAE